MRILNLKSISKYYRIFDKPQDRFKAAIASRFNLKSKQNIYYKKYWALKNINLKVEAGESLGIIGKNGSGKSTLLQIIAGTTFPNDGTIESHGRITALLELGSGFNQEFTGKENIFMNGQILGLNRKYIEDKYDDIVSFADIGEFINQPVKTYSSGMLMRLAFSVQTALEPDILIVDEALSVGDMFFQAKCFSRIRKLLDNGITFIFVSHEIGAVKELCQRSIFLDKGEIISSGNTKLVTDLYLKQNLYKQKQSSDKDYLKKSSSLDNKKVKNQPASDKKKDQNLNNLFIYENQIKYDDLLIGKEVFKKISSNNRVQNKKHQIENVQIISNENLSYNFDYGERVIIRVLVKSNEDANKLNLAIKITTVHGINILFMDSRLQEKTDFNFKEKSFYLFSWIVEMKIMHGDYFLNANLSYPPEENSNNWQFIDVIPNAYKFTMNPRYDGMIDGFYANSTKLNIRCLTN